MTSFVYDIPGKWYDFGQNLNNGVCLFFDSLSRCATIKTCEIFNLKPEDDFESAVKSAEDKGVATQFMAIYNSILEKEAKRTSVAEEVLHAAKMMRIQPSDLECVTLQSIN